MTMPWKKVISGAATYVPGALKLYEYKARRSTKGTYSARYCYSVWLRHLVKAREHGLGTDPKSVAELGPGNSLGMGLAALLTGSDRYFAFEVTERTNLNDNLRVLDELVELFRQRVAIPAGEDFPRVKPFLDDYSFPDDPLSIDRMRRALSSERVERIRRSLLDPSREDSMIQYRVPWSDSAVIEPHSIDLIFSQAVLEHVNDLDATYETMSIWLKISGHMSHQIDFKCHRTAKEWNGHWRYSDLRWALIRGRRSYLLNREPHSTHLRLLERHDFQAVCDQVVRQKSVLTRQELAGRFSALTDDDLVTSGAFIMAVKRTGRRDAEVIV